jgi:RimJ/RimL family protein N-acetyltransferase
MKQSQSPDRYVPAVDTEGGEYQVFIPGETVDLCVPSRLAIERDGWADWFNDEKVVRYLDHGVYPNRVEDQDAFYASLQTSNRFAVLMRPKDSSRAIGIISLSNINLVRRAAQISLVVGHQPAPARLVALESMARVTEHGFEKLGLERIWAGQAFPGLARWNKMLELLGYRSEGIQRRGFNKGREAMDSAIISCLYETYAQIKKLRDGAFWHGNSAMFELIKHLPKEGFAEQLDRFLASEGEQYYKSLKLV